MPSSVGGPSSAQMQHLAALQAAAATRGASAMKVAAPASASASAPAGETSLWDVLTAEEKSFFADAAQMGPLTYGPRPRAGGAPLSPALPRGQRIDVRG